LGEEKKRTEGDSLFPFGWKGKRKKAHERKRRETEKRFAKLKEAEKKGEGFSSRKKKNGPSPREKRIQLARRKGGKEEKRG